MLNFNPYCLSSGFLIEETGFFEQREKLFLGKLLEKAKNLLLTKPAPVVCFSGFVIIIIKYNF